MLEELLDRFGEMPKAVLNLLVIARMKAQAHRCYVVEIKQIAGDMKITLYERAKLNPAGIPVLMQKYRRGLQFKNEQEPKFILASRGSWKYTDSSDRFSDGTGITCRRIKSI